MKRVAVIALFLAAIAAFAGDKKSDQYADLKFVVLKEDTGKPVRNAAVIMHPVNKDGRQENSGLELKTDAEGRAQFDSVPYGKLRVQVIARGFQTYGEDFDINQPAHEITIKLKRPQGQYSIYDK
jgi:5-hydroxyisourate hydrolase-like protein (transthyretin family)